MPVITTPLATSGAASLSSPVSSRPPAAPDILAGFHIKPITNASG